MKVYAVVHKFENGDQVEVFKSKKSQEACYRKIMQEYAAEYGINPKAKNDSELNEASDGKVSLVRATWTVQE